MPDGKVNLPEDDKKRRKLLIKVREELTSEIKPTIAKKLVESVCMSFCVLEGTKWINERDGREPKEDKSVFGFFHALFLFFRFTADQRKISSLRR